MTEQKTRSEIRRVELRDPGGDLVVFYEIDEIFTLANGEERRHTSRERAFKTEQEAKAWIEDQSKRGAAAGVPVNANTNCTPSGNRTEAAGRSSQAEGH